MHELSVVRSLIETLEKLAADQKAQSVTKILLNLHPLSGFDSDDIQFSFDLLKKEKPLFSGAELNIHVAKGIVRCQECRHEFTGKFLPDICSRCGSMNLVPQEPMGLILQEYEIEK